MVHTSYLFYFSQQRGRVYILYKLDSKLITKQCRAVRYDVFIKRVCLPRAFTRPRHINPRSGRVNHALTATSHKCAVFLSLESDSSRFVTIRSDRHRVLSIISAQTTDIDFSALSRERRKRVSRAQTGIYIYISFCAYQCFFTLNVYIYTYDRIFLTNTTL